MAPSDPEEVPDNSAAEWNTHALWEAHKRLKRRHRPAEEDDLHRPGFCRGAGHLPYSLLPLHMLLDDELADDDEAGG